MPKSEGVVSGCVIALIHLPQICDAAPVEHNYHPASLHGAEFSLVLCLQQWLIPGTTEGSLRPLAWVMWDDVPSCPL